MAQTINTDVRTKLNAVIDLFKDDLFGKMRNGVQATLECAQTSGSEKLIKSCEAASEGTDAMIKVFDSLIECAERYSVQLQKLENAM